MKIKLRAILLATVISAATSHAQHMNAKDAPCRGSMVGADETACFVAAAKQQDRELNQYYTLVTAVLAPDEIKELQTTQRAWLRFRDASCTSEKGMYDGGSAQPMVYYACLEAETRYRTNDLKNTYDWVIEKRR